MGWKIKMSQKDLGGMLGRRDFLRLAAIGTADGLSIAFAPTSAFAGDRHSHPDHQQYSGRYHEEGYQHLEIGEDEITGKIFVVKPEEKKLIGPAIHSSAIKTATGDRMTEYSVGTEYKLIKKVFKPNTNGRSTLDIKRDPRRVVFYDDLGTAYEQKNDYHAFTRLPYFEEVNGPLQYFPLERELPGFNYYGYGKFKGNIDDVVLSRFLEDIQAKVIIYASEAELIEYENLQKKGILPKTIKAFTFLDSAEAEKMKGNRTIESVGRYDFGVLGHLKLLKSDVNPVFLSMAQNHWLEMSKRVFVGKSLKAAEAHGAKYVRLITGDSPSDAVRYSGTLTGKVTGGGSFLGWGIDGQFSGMIGSNSDYSLLGACELYKAR